MPSLQVIPRQGKDPELDHRLAELLAESEARLAKTSMQMRMMEARQVELLSAHQGEVQDLRSEHTRAVEAARAVSEMQAAIHRTNVAMTENAKDRDAAQHIAILEATIKTNHAEEKARLVEKYEAKLSSLETMHAEQVTTLEAKLISQATSENEMKISELETAHSETLTSIMSVYKRVENKVKQLEAQRLRADEVAEKGLRELAKLHRDQMVALEQIKEEELKRHVDYIQSIQEEHKSRISEMEEAHLTNVDALETALMADLETHKRELDAHANAQLAKKVEEMESRHVEIAAAHKAQVSKLRIECFQAKGVELAAVESRLVGMHQAALMSTIDRKDEETRQAIDSAKALMAIEHEERLSELAAAHRAKIASLEALLSAQSQDAKAQQAKSNAEAVVELSKKVAELEARNNFLVESHSARVEKMLLEHHGEMVQMDKAMTKASVSNHGEDGITIGDSCLDKADKRELFRRKTPIAVVAISALGFYLLLKRAK